MSENFEEMKARYLKELRELGARRPSPPLRTEEKTPAVASPLLEPVSAVPLSVSTAEPVMPPVYEKQEEMSPVLPEENDKKKAVLPDYFPEDVGMGYLTVWAVTADGALPVPDANVIVTRRIKGEKTLQGFGLTNRSGLTRAFPLPAPSAGLSLSPDNPSPFARYDILVRRVGFANAEYLGVPIFDGIRSNQQADLVPAVNGQSEDAVNEEQGLSAAEPAAEEGVEA